MNAFSKLINNIDKVKISQELKPAFLIAIKEMELAFAEFNLLDVIDFDKFFEKYVICDGINDENKMKFVMFKQTPNEIVENNGTIKLSKKHFEEIKNKNQSQYEMSPVQVLNTKDKIFIENFFGKPYFVSSKLLNSENNGAYFEKENLIVILPNGYNEYQNNSYYQNKFTNHDEMLAMLLTHELIHFLTIHGEIEFNKNESHYTVFKEQTLKDNKKIKYLNYTNKRKFAYYNSFCEIVADFMTSKIYNLAYTTHYSHASKFIDFIEFIYDYDCMRDIMQRSHNGFFENLGDNVFEIVFSYLNDFFLSNGDVIQSKDYTDAIDVLLYFYKEKVLSKNMSFEKFLNLQTHLVETIPYSTKFELKEKINEINRAFVVDHMKKQNLEPIKEYVEILTKKLSKATLISVNNDHEIKRNYKNIVTIDLGLNKFAFGRKDNSLYMTSQRILNTHKIIPTLKLIDNLSKFDQTVFSFTLQIDSGLPFVQINKLQNSPIIITDSKKNIALSISFKNDNLIFLGETEKILHFGVSNKKNQLKDIEYFFNEFVYLSKTSFREKEKPVKDSTLQ